MQKIIIAHQYHCPEHFVAIFESQAFQIDYRVLDPFYYLDALLKKKKSFRHCFRYICVALFNLIYLNFKSGKTVIFALPPYHPLMFFYLPFLSRNNVVFFTSWPFWGDQKKTAIGPKILAPIWIKTIKRHVKKVACVNLNSFQYWDQYLPCSLVEHCIPTEKYLAKTSYKSQGKLVYIGRRAEYKNVDRLINLIKGMKNLCLDIVGETNKTPYKNHSGNINFIGHQPKRWIQGNLSEYDALALISEWSEPYGIVLLEAMAAGVPILVTKTAGTETIFRDLDYEYMADSSGDQDVRNLILKFNKADDVTKMKTGQMLKDLSQKYGVKERLKIWQKLLTFN